jgi:hypothetical protein
MRDSHAQVRPKASAGDQAGFGVLAKRTAGCAVFLNGFGETARRIGSCEELRTGGHTGMPGITGPTI